MSRRIDRIADAFLVDSFSIVHAMVAFYQPTVASSLILTLRTAASSSIVAHSPT